MNIVDAMSVGVGTLDDDALPLLKSHSNSVKVSEDVFCIP